MTTTDSTDQQTELKPLDIEIWSDVVCPWCFIGKRKFEAGLELFQAAHPDVEVNVSYRAFMLDPTAKPGLSQPVAEAYAKKFGGPEKAAQILDHVTKAAAEVGLDYHMDIALRANTALAHRSIAFAAAHGKQHGMKERVMQAYFSEGSDIGSPETLLDLGQEIGLDRATMQAYLESDGGKIEVAGQLEAAAELGISSVPTFVFNREFGIPGAQGPEYFVRVMEKMSGVR